MGGAGASGLLFLAFCSEKVMRRYTDYAKSRAISFLATALLASLAGNAWQLYLYRTSPATQAAQHAAAAKILGPALRDNPAYLAYLERVCK